jgi:hypothetical protein
MQLVLSVHHFSSLIPHFPRLHILRATEIENEQKDIYTEFVYSSTEFSAFDDLKGRISPRFPKMDHTKWMG